VFGATAVGPNLGTFYEQPQKVLRTHLAGLPADAGEAQGVGQPTGPSLGFYTFGYDKNGNLKTVTASNAAILALPEAVQQAAAALALYASFKQSAMPPPGSITINGATLILSVLGASYTGASVGVFPAESPTTALPGWTNLSVSQVPAAVVIALANESASPPPVPLAQGTSWREVPTTDGRVFGATFVGGSAVGWYVQSASHPVPVSHVPTRRLA
jgi:hypothetical protein